MLKNLIMLLSAGLVCTTISAGDKPTALQDALLAQEEKVQARYGYRHPGETLEFFEVKPGMTVVEGLPGSGWYSKILLPYLGSDGELIGADYAEDMYPLFGFFGEDYIAAKKTWVADWTGEASGWSGDDGADVAAFQLGSMPEKMKGTADAVVLIRALHNLARFEEKGGYLTTALANAFDVLKPGGVVGVVQHKARDEMPDDWANGSRGYLKQSFVIEHMEKAGFVLEASSDMNNNPADQPTTDDIVWRLPPTLATSGDNEELMAQLKAIGESNRMTLRFRKPE